VDNGDPLMASARKSRSKISAEVISGDGLGCIADRAGIGLGCIRAENSGERKATNMCLNGSKTFITNTIYGDLFIVFRNVDFSKGANGVTGFSDREGTPGLVVAEFATRWA